MKKINCPKCGAPAFLSGSMNWTYDWNQGKEKDKRITELEEIADNSHAVGFRDGVIAEKEKLTKRIAELVRFIEKADYLLDIDKEIANELLQKHKEG
jgi:hypothetical protein